MRMWWSAAVIAAAMFTAGQVAADDSTAALGGGGIVFTKSADVRMAKEDLRISPNDVRIRYEFVNDGKRDIDTVVAFPLPDIDAYEFFGTPIGRVSSDPVNFVDFRVVVDGKPVHPAMEQKAIFKGRDVTAIVKSAGLPVNIVVGQNYQRMDKLPAAQRKKLTAAGIAEYDGDNGIAKWTIRTRFYWNQRFPAGKTVVIEHTYLPIIGEAFFTDLDLTPKAGSKDDGWKKPYCMDDKTLSATAALLKAHKARDQNEGMLNAQSVDFILKTANNWKGGIGRLHLTIDKLAPSNILSLCWDGALKRTGPTTYEAVRENFAPASDLKFVVLR
jgi:hypothetical protein